MSSNHKSLQRLLLTTAHQSLHPDSSEIQHHHIMALLTGEESLSVVHQPLVDLETGLIVGSEILTRTTLPWNIEQVIKAASDLELLDEFTSYLLRHFIPKAWSIAEVLEAHGEEWPEALRDAEGKPLYRLNVNMSQDQFFPGNPLLEEFASLVVPDNIKLVLELTEHGSDTWSDANEAAVAPLELRGFGVGLDDLGAGMTRLGFLQRRDWSIIKIDRRFLGEYNERDEVLLKLMIQLCDSFKIPSLVEGIETPRDHRHIVEAGARYGQGFYYGKPVPLSVHLGNLERNWGSTASERKALWTPYVTGKMEG